MTTPATGPAGARTVAVATVAVAAVKKFVDDPTHDRATKKAMVDAIYRMANGTASGRGSGLVEGPDWNCAGSPGATVAFRERLTPDNRRIPELVGAGPNDRAASQVATHALGRTPGEPVPGYPTQAPPTNTVDDRTTVLNSKQVVQNGLSTESPTHRQPEGGFGAKPPTVGQPPQTQNQPRTR